MTAVAALVDAMLDHARSSHPNAEWTITLDQADSLLLPMDSDKLFREADGRLGCYRGHVYRDSLVVEVDLLERYADTITLSSHDRKAPVYWGDLHTGTFSTDVPSRCRCEHG